MKLLVLGNSAGGPFHGRHYASQILQVDNHYFLIDCGEGTQMQLFEYRVKVDRVNQIFISHLHGDHVFGLMGLLTNWCLKKRVEPLHIFAPLGLEELVWTTCRLCHVRVPYPLIFHEVDPTQSTLVFENKRVEVLSIPLNHRIPTVGWLFREKPRLPKIKKELVDQYQIHYSLIPGIKNGDDLTLPDGRILPNSELVIPSPPAGSYAYCSDTAPSDLVAETVRDVQLLYHEATFTDDHLEEAAISFHSTAAQAATIARKAGAGKLLLGHFSGRYPDPGRHLEEARAIFPETEASAEGVYIDI